MYLELLLAYRFLRGAQENYLSSIMTLCVVSISIGVCSFLLATSIASGFEQATYEKLKGVHADGLIRGHGKPLDYLKIKQVILKEYKDMIDEISPSDSYSVVTRDVYGDLGPVACLKGVDPRSLAQITRFESALIAQYKNVSFEDLFKDSGVIIGEKIAQQLTVSVGDRLTLFFPETELLDRDSERDCMKFGSYQVFVAGIVKTGIEEVDEQIILCSLSLMRDIFPQSAPTEIGFAYGKTGNSKNILRMLRERFSTLEVYSWQDLYPPLVAALALEKYTVACIVFLIMLVASMNMIALLYMYIHKKRKLFAVCRIMGMSDRSLQFIIISMGLYIAALSALIGLLLAFIAGTCIQRFVTIPLPDMYYIGTLPVQMSLLLFIKTFFATLLIGACAGALASIMRPKISVSSTLRSEE